MKKGGMQTFGRIVLRSPSLWNELSLQARIDELADAGLVPELLDVRLHELSQETSFPFADLRDLLAVSKCWHELRAARPTAIAA